jgi:8-oxo-dGTP pyrophosphatase MutT (NUDIX family)
MPSPTERIEPVAPEDVEVLAAGGVLVRRGIDGDAALEVAVIHRPRRADWSFPKGKLDGGEDLATCALRELEEETGFRCRLGRFVGWSHYLDRAGRRKAVAYWLAEPLDGQFVPHEEVDELRWLPVGEARSLLSYDDDRELLDRALGLVGEEPTSGSSASAAT